MLHPSYTDLMNVVNADALEDNEQPIVNSRYSIVMATSKRARQIIDKRNKEKNDLDNVMVVSNEMKPLSEAIEELENGSVKILPEDSAV